MPAGLELGNPNIQGGGWCVAAQHMHASACRHGKVAVMQELSLLSVLLLHEEPGQQRS